MGAIFISTWKEIFVSESLLRGWMGTSRLITYNLELTWTIHFEMMCMRRRIIGLLQSQDLDGKPTFEFIVTGWSVNELFRLKAPRGGIVLVVVEDDRVLWRSTWFVEKEDWDLLPRVNAFGDSYQYCSYYKCWTISNYLLKNERTHASCASGFMVPRDPVLIKNTPHGLRVWSLIIWNWPELFTLKWCAFEDGLLGYCKAKLDGKPTFGFIVTGWSVNELFCLKAPRGDIVLVVVKDDRVLWRST